MIVVADERLVRSGFRLVHVSRGRAALVAQRTGSLEDRSS
jgi:hypothetical protein